MNDGYEFADRRGSAEELLHDVENHAAVDAMAVARLLTEERRRVILRLHGDEAVVAAQTPAPGVPFHAAADVAGEERLGVVDAEARALEETESADAASDVRHHRALPGVDDDVAAVVEDVRRLHVTERRALEVERL